MFTKSFFASIIAWFIIFGTLTVLVFLDHSNYKYIKYRQDMINQIVEDGRVKHIEQPSGVDKKDAAK